MAIQRLRQIIIAGFIASVCIRLEAAIDRQFAADMKKHQYVANGMIVGGESGKSFTLLGVRRLLSQKDKIERVFFDLGDDKGQPLKNRVSYFQVSVDRDKSRVVIDLSQMTATDVDANKLLKTFQGSPYVKEAKISYDPLDTSLSVQLHLKKNVLVEAFKLSSKDKPSRIVVDLKEG